MLQNILKLLAKEQSFEILIAQSETPLQTAIAQISDPTNPYEIKEVLVGFFSKFIYSCDPASVLHSESMRLCKIIDQCCSDAIEAQKAAIPASRDANDDLVDLYMESLKYFASTLSESVLDEHISYLDQK
ncbi:hypothetical protein ENBRE01_0806 [Enteropsectra breve]|nr:hypothetical protein ENBRE01_0806 [Enteropsectra breve]